MTTEPQPWPNDLVLSIVRTLMPILGASPDHNPQMRDHCCMAIKGLPNPHAQALAAVTADRDRLVAEIKTFWGMERKICQDRIAGMEREESWRADLTKERDEALAAAGRYSDILRQTRAELADAVSGYNRLITERDDARKEAGGLRGSLLMIDAEFAGGIKHVSTARIWDVVKAALKDGRGEGEGT